MDWRLNWMADSLRFDGCSVYRALGEPTDFPAGIRSAFVPHLTASAAPCAAPREGEERRWPLYVRVDSLRLGETEGRAYVRVFRGEHDHFEEFRLMTRGGPEWFVSEMRMWGAAQSYPARRPSS